LFQKVFETFLVYFFVKILQKGVKIPNFVFWDFFSVKYSNFETEKGLTGLFMGSIFAVDFKNE